MEISFFNSFINFVQQEWLAIFSLIISISLSIYFYIKSKRKSSISAIIKTSTIINENDTQFPNEVEIKFKGKKIKNLSKSEIFFKNNGTETIDGNDIVQEYPILVKIDSGGTILQYQLIDNYRNENKIVISKCNDDENILIVKFGYLDSNDVIHFEMLHDTLCKPKITGSIKKIPTGIKILKNSLNDDYNILENKNLFFVITLQLMKAFNPALFDILQGIKSKPHSTSKK